MRTFGRLCLLVALATGAAVGACGEDEGNVVRTRPDGGPDASLDGPVEGGPPALGCGVLLPTTYDSPSFAANAKEELDLKGHLRSLSDKMKTAEGASPLPVTAAELQAIFTAGPPSLRTVATAYTQATVDSYLVQFADASTKTWKPEDVEPDGGVDGGAPTGGRYDSGSIVSAAGLDLRAATEQILLDGSLYNYALQLAGGAISAATVDRLLALYGASPAFANSADAGDQADQLMAAYASQRDNKTGAPGPYRKVRSALIVALAAATAGDKCRADLDGALKIFFLEWEKTAFATVIYDLDQAATAAVAIPARANEALRAYGQAIGLAQSFKGIPQDRRKITDVQIDAVLMRIGMTTPYQLVTKTGERIVAFNTAYQEIGAIYGMSQTDIEEAKKAY